MDFCGFSLTLRKGVTYGNKSYATWIFYVRNQDKNYRVSKRWVVKALAGDALSITRSDDKSRCHRARVARLATSRAVPRPASNHCHIDTPPEGLHAYFRMFDS